MLTGLRVEKKDNAKQSKKDKKEEKKEKKKKEKKETQAKKAEQISSSSSSASSEAGGKRAEAEGAEAGSSNPDVQRQTWMVKQPRIDEDDFFSRMGGETRAEREKKMKPNPDEIKISEREYNPHLRGEVSDQPAAESVGHIPR